MEEPIGGMYFNLVPKPHTAYCTYTHSVCYLCTISDDCIYRSEGVRMLNYVDVLCASAIAALGHASVRHF